MDIICIEHYLYTVYICYQSIIRKARPLGAKHLHYK